MNFLIVFTVQFAVEIPVATDDDVPAAQVTDQVAGHETGHENGQVTAQVEKLVKVLKTDLKNRDEIMELLQLKHRENTRLTYILPALEGGYITMLYPDKPKSSKQKYYLTDKGKILYEQIKNEQ